MGNDKEKSAKMVGALSRDAFNQSVLKRDNSECVLCGSKDNLCVHHIIERKLWVDGGYYVTNGVTLCPTCHIQAESCFVMPSVLWDKIGLELCGIGDLSFLYPDGWALDVDYDKWGQEILYEGYDHSFVVVPNEFKSKFEKAVRLAGGIVREVNAEWLNEYMSIGCECNALYVSKLSKIETEKPNGLY